LQAFWLVWCCLAWHHDVLSADNTTHFGMSGFAQCIHVHYPLIKLDPAYKDSHFKDCLAFWRRLRCKAASCARYSGSCRFTFVRALLAWITVFLWASSLWYLCCLYNRILSSLPLYILNHSKGMQISGSSCIKFSWLVWDLQPAFFFVVDVCEAPRVSSVMLKPSLHKVDNFSYVKGTHANDIELWMPWRTW